jgi:hypothetical protein
MLSDLSLESLEQLEADLFLLLDESLTTCYYGGLYDDDLSRQIETTLRAVTELRILVETQEAYV